MRAPARLVMVVVVRQSGLVEAVLGPRLGVERGCW
jgi:hypothetical protein